MTPVMYVGKKPKKTDNHRSFGTGIIWNGAGDIKPVEDGIAKAMVTMYPEVWALAEADDADAFNDVDRSPASIDDEHADPGNNPADFAEMHWTAAVRYVQEASFEELQDFLALEEARERPRPAVLESIQKRLS